MERAKGSISGRGASVAARSKSFVAMSSATIMLLFVQPAPANRKNRLPATLLAQNIIAEDHFGESAPSEVSGSFARLAIRLACEPACTPHSRAIFEVRSYALSFRGEAVGLLAKGLEPGIVRLRCCSVRR
jgi:hypothetical protein